MIIDTHHHFWNYNPVDFDWIDDEMALIRKNFLPNDLKKTISKTDVSGVISVQARQSLEETDWLLQMASENDFIKGIVGWLPLASENIQPVLEKYSSNNLLKGVRHVVQGEPDPEFILGKKFNKGVSLLKNVGLIYDILIFEHQLPNTIRFADRHPNQIFVLDHIAKPKIKNNEIEHWKKYVKELSKRENVFCKISGMVTEANFTEWTVKQLQPYFDIVLDTFGPKRLMFGSDWPVCLVATDYKTWVEIVKSQLAPLSKYEQNLILYENATRIYNL
ncbi:amidohydrolase family protein [Maribellus comscasis]|uniref:Amidohydrolase family protein n=1 Tax=Maribellus comscasis TaxID=2681766 RepID=A0A6I6JYC5_9BACT|nr:amidohydrolase family protein [Maribellus comscasis]QGY42714.1 amidohydrolase family protein [Maribellus comscasis]